MSDTGFVVGGRIFRNKPKEPPRETPASNGFVAGNRIFRKTPPEPSVTTPPDDRNLFQQFGDFVTGGEEREGQRDQTEMITQLMHPSLDPETDPLAGVSQTQQLKAQAGLIANMTPEGRIQILQENIPGLKVIDGNTVEVGGKQFIVNKDGFSNMDAQMLLGGLMALAGPQKGLNRIPNIWARGAAAFPAFAGTQMGLDHLGQLLGSEKGVDLVNAGIVGAFGPVATWASPAISMLMRSRGLLNSAGELTGYGTKILDKLEVPKFIRDNKEFLNVFNQMFKEASGRITGGGGPAAVRASQAEALGFQLTKGQKTQDAGQLALEGKLAKVDSDKGNPFADFLAVQNEDIAKAAENIRSNLVPKPTKRKVIQQTGGEIPIGPADAGQNVHNIILGRVERLEGMVNKAYDLAGRTGGNVELSKASFSQYTNAMIQGLKEQGSFSGALLEKSKPLNRTSARIRELRQMLKTERGGPATRERIAATYGPTRAVANPLTMTRIERFRKGLVQDINSTKLNDPGDYANLIVMKGELDKWLSQAFDTALFTGNQNALNQFKRARNLYTQLRQGFHSRGKGDVAGGVLDKMIQKAQFDGLDSVQAMNMVFGGQKMGFNGSAVVKRLADVFGKESDEFRGIQGAALHKIIWADSQAMNDFSAKAVSGRIDQLLTGRFANLGNALFDKKQLAELSNFSDAVKNTLPTRGNPRGNNMLVKLATAVQDNLGIGIIGGAALAGAQDLISPAAMHYGMAGGVLHFGGQRLSRSGASVSPRQLRQATSTSYRHWLPAPASVPLFTGAVADVGRRTAEEVPAELLASNVMSMMP